MVVPVDADVHEAEHVGEKDRQMGRKSSNAVPSGTLSSRTMIVNTIASTPSLNASRRSVPIV
jgi:hypothetical protein